MTRWKPDNPVSITIPSGTTSSKSLDNWEIYRIEWDLSPVKLKVYVNKATDSDSVRTPYATSEFTITGAPARALLDQPTTRNLSVENDFMEAVWAALNSQGDISDGTYI